MGKEEIELLLLCTFSEPHATKSRVQTKKKISYAVWSTLANDMMQLRIRMPQDRVLVRVHRPRRAHHTQVRDRKVLCIRGRYHDRTASKIMHLLFLLFPHFPKHVVTHCTVSSIGSDDDVAFVAGVVRADNLYAGGLAFGEEDAFPETDPVRWDSVEEDGVEIWAGEHEELVSRAIIIRQNSEGGETTKITVAFE